MVAGVSGQEGAVSDQFWEPKSDFPDRVASDEALQAVAERNDTRVQAAREQLYASGLDLEQAAQRIGVQPNQVNDLLRDGDLLALDGPNGLRLPAWQFDRKARHGRLEGIARVAAEFPGQLLWLSSWMAQPNPVLDGRTPRQAMLDGDVEQVVTAAANVGR